MWTSSVCSLIIPTRNEASNLGRLLDSLPDFIDEVIVVDGASTDDTIQIANRHQRVQVVISQRMKGKGAALSRGFDSARGDFVFIIDSDGSMNPDELEAMAIQLSSGADVVKGSRYLSGGGSTDLTWFRSIGNRTLTILANRLYNTKWTDIAYGYAGFRRESLSQLEIAHFDNKIAGNLTFRSMSYGQGFEIETLMFCRAARRGLVVVEVPSCEQARWAGASNLVAIPDGIRAFSALILERIRSRRIRSDF